MSDIAVCEVRLDNMEKTLSEILTCVKETNGSVREHDVSIAKTEEWKKSVHCWKRDMNHRFDKRENRLWAMVLAGSTLGAITGAIASVFVK